MINKLNLRRHETNEMEENDGGNQETTETYRSHLPIYQIGLSLQSGMEATYSEASNP